MSSKIHERVGPGIYRLRSGGFRVKVAVGDRGRGGRQRETTFAADAGLREMKAWQTSERSSLLRQGIVPARGTLEADVPTYLSKMTRKLAYADSREDEINAWLDRFGKRRRHTITRDEVQTEWIERAIRQPIREYVQADGRIRRWTQVAVMEGRYLRVILLPDGETVHNAFFDRGFKP